MTRAACHIVWAAAMLVPVLLGAASALRPTVTVEVAPDRIGLEDGRAYRVPIEAGLGFPAALVYAVLPDEAAHPFRSSLVLYEDGARLGPAHSPVRLIAAGGGGSFVHWGGALWFSSRDGTDPRSGRHRYVAEAKAQLRPEIVWSGAVLFLACLGALLRLGPRGFARGAADPRMLAAPAVAAAALWLAANAEVYAVSHFHPLLSWDSISYLAGSAFRGFLYPAILKALAWLEPSARLLVPLQLNFMLLSFALLGWSVGRFTGSRFLGWVTGLLLAANTGLLRHALPIASEAPFIGLVSLHLAAALCVLRRPSAPAAVLAGLTAGLAILVRPAGYSLLLTAPFLAAAAGPARLRVAVRTALPAGVALLLGAGVHAAASGGFATQSIGGFSLLGHVLHLARPGLRTPYPELYERILQATAPAVTSTDAAYPAEYWRATSLDYNTLLWSKAVPQIAAHAAEEARRRGEPWPSSGNIFSDMTDNAALTRRLNDISLDLALGIVADGPWMYARHVAAHVYGMWMGLFADYGPLPVSSLPYAADGPSIGTWRQVKDYFGRPGYPAERIRAIMEQADPATLSTAIWSAVRPVLRGLALAAPFLTLAAIGAAVLGAAAGRAPSRPTVGLAFCALQIWAYFGLVAATQAALDRYSVVFEPVLTVALVLGCAALAAWAKALARRVGGERTPALSYAASPLSKP